MTPGPEKLGIGSVQFGQAYGVSKKHGQVPVEDVRAILTLARDAGIGLIDTAANYGTAEHVLSRLDTTGFRIVTKATNLNKGLDVALARVRESKRLLPKADTVLVHMADDLFAPGGADYWRGLLAMRDEGLFRKVGISAYAAQDPAELARRFRPDVMQLPVSMLDQRLLRDGSLARLKDMGVEIHARSIFLQGLLFLETMPASLAHALPEIDAIRKRIGESGTTPLAAALAFALSRPEIDIALVGVAETAQLAEIIAVARAPMSPIDWQACALHDELVLTPSKW